MDTLRVFVRFLETIDAVRDSSEKVQSPGLGSREDVPDELLEGYHAVRLDRRPPTRPGWPAARSGGAVGAETLMWWAGDQPA